MNTRPLLKALAAALLAAALLAAVPAARAQLFRTYLSTAGNDTNPCTLQQPCRLLPAGIAAAANGGEVWLLDSANYNSGTVAIGKSVVIVAVPGVIGSVVATGGGPAIQIDAQVNVTLRNLVIAPLATNPGTHGVALGAGLVVIENSLIAGLPGDGVRIDGLGSIRMVDSTIRNSGGWGANVASGGVITLASTRLLDNAAGGVRTFCGPDCDAGGPRSSRAYLTESLVSGGSRGVDAQNDGATSIARISVTRSTIDSTGRALSAATGGSGTAEVLLSSSLVSHNLEPWAVGGTGAVVRTTQNNHFFANGAPVGVLTPIALQ